MIRTYQEIRDEVIENAATTIEALEQYKTKFLAIALSELGEATDENNDRAIGKVNQTINTLLSESYFEFSIYMEGLEIKVDYDKLDDLAIKMYMDQFKGDK